jgi:hypothetical protein
LNIILSREILLLEAAVFICTIAHNSSPTIQSNTISGNITGYGGGIYISGGSPGPDILNNTISVNTANTEGGGIYIINCSPNIQANTVCSNTLAQIYPDSYSSNNYISTHCDIIGQIGPAGGWIFYDKGYVSDGWQYLEAAPSDQSGPYHAWSNIIDVEIGTSAQGTAIGTGQTNTTAIIGQTGHTTSAAKLCDDLIVGSYDDWFLPSEDELNLMYTNLYNEGVGGFANDSYWSSSEVNELIARIMRELVVLLTIVIGVRLRSMSSSRGSSTFGLAPPRVTTVNLTSLSGFGLSGLFNHIYPFTH